MGRPRVAINTTVAASLVGVDRPLEADVRALILADDGQRPKRRHRRRNLGGEDGVVVGPAIIERLDLGTLEATAGVRSSAPAARYWLSFGGGYHESVTGQ